MRPVARLPRAFLLGWRDLDRAFLGWVALSLLVHGATAAAVPRVPRVEPDAGAPARVAGFVALGAAPDPGPAEDRWRPHQGIHEMLGSPAGGGSAVGDLLAFGALDTDLALVLAAVEGVRLPRPGERLTLRPRPPPPAGIYSFGCGVDATGRVFCRCVTDRHPRLR